MKQIRVLFNTSPGAFKNTGGGEIQLLKTKEYLKEEGVRVEILGRMNAKEISEFDVFHNFNIHRDCFGAVKRAKKAGLAIAISTIYWPSWQFNIKGGMKFSGKIKSSAAGAINKFDFAGISKVRKMLGMADVLLPNSKSEAEILRNDFGAKGGEINVVHNGVEKRFKSGKPGLFREKYGLDKFVLYVGRIEPRKNVLGLIKAMKGTDIPLVIVGESHTQHGDYFKECKKEAGGNVKFIGKVPHDSEMLASAYAATRVFALPSWYETPGLAALEAALAGANIVITKEGCTREYFGNLVSYVNPVDTADVREKIMREFEKPMSRKLQEHVEENFLWERTAQETISAYKSILHD